jgi:GNAT superfamily N-acetyltransferase
MSLEISGVTVSGLMADPDIEALIAEYEAEAKSPELPPAAPQWQQYAALERAGVLDVITARHDGALIGFVSVLKANLPHYGGDVSVVESLFVSAAHRGTGAGRALIKAAECIASCNGPGLLITAPAGSALERVLPRLGFRHSNTVFAKGTAKALAIPSMGEGAIEAVSRLETAMAALPQARIATHHVLHGGCYTRTILMPAGTRLVGALVDIVTTLIVSGDCTVAIGDGQSQRLTGYHVLPAEGRRKQAFAAHADTHLTMVFATKAKTVAEAEDQFTAEAHKLMSRQPGSPNTLVVTGR